MQKSVNGIKIVLLNAPTVSSLSSSSPLSFCFDWLWFSFCLGRNQKQRIRALEEVVRHLPVGLMSSSLITDSEVDIAAATTAHSPPSNDPIWNYSDHDHESSSNTVQPITLPIMRTSIFKDQLTREKRDDLSMVSRPKT
jgi:hypothetical protein